MGRSFLPVLRGKKQKGREFVYTHINTIASGRSLCHAFFAGEALRVDLERLA